MFRELSATGLPFIIMPEQCFSFALKTDNLVSTEQTNNAGCVSGMADKMFTGLPVVPTALYVL